MTYNAEKKNLTPLHVGEKFLTPEVWEKILTQTKGRAIIFLTWGAGAGNFHKETFISVRPLLQTSCWCLRLPANTLFCLYTVYFSVYSLFQNFPPSPSPLPFKKVIFRPWITHTPSQKSNGQLLRGWGKKQIWHLSIKWHSSTRLAGARSSCGGFLDQSFAFQDWKHAAKRHKMGRESSKECPVSLLWTNESLSLWNCLSRNSTLFSSRRSAWLALSKLLGIEVFEETSGAFCTIWSRKVCF